MAGVAELVLAIIGGWFVFSIGLGVLLVVQRVWRDRRFAADAPASLRRPTLGAVDIDHLR